MNELNQVVRKYLELNGISVKFFSDYIGCDHSVCSRWLIGKRKLNSEQIRKTHEFLAGKHIKSIDKVMEGE